MNPCPRTAFLPAAFLAALTFGGVARADVYISDTVNGSVTSGIDYLGYFGAPDADLTGAAVSYTFSYDFTSLAAAAAAGTNGSVYSNFLPFDQFYVDYANDAAETESVTIDSHTVSVTSNFSASAGVIGFLSDNPNHPPILTSYVQNLTTGAIVESDLFGVNNFPANSLGDQAAVNAFIAAPTNFDGYGNQLFDLSDGSSTDFIYANTSLAPAPEPSLWFSLALGFGGMVLVKTRRRADRD